MVQPDQKKCRKKDAVFKPINLLRNERWSLSTRMDWRFAPPMDRFPIPTQESIGMNWYKLDFTVRDEMSDAMDSNYGGYVWSHTLRSWCDWLDWVGLKLIKQFAEGSHYLEGHFVKLAQVCCSRFRRFWLKFINNNSMISKSKLGSLV